MSCSPPRFSCGVGTTPDSTSTGALETWALAMPVIALVTPGPAVTSATPSLPVNSAWACAMWTAARSSRTSMMRMPSASARIKRGMMCPPQRAKMRSTPRALRKRATTPAAELAVGLGGFTRTFLGQGLAPARHRRSRGLVGEGDDPASGADARRSGRHRPCDVLAGLPRMLRGAARGLDRVVRDQRLHDRFVLVPDLTMARRLLQHLRHGAPQMVPVEADRVGEERVASDTADPEVEAHVRFDQRVDTAGLRRLAAFGDQLAALGGVPRRAPLRGQARGQRVERFPQLVCGAEELALERRDDHAATPRIAHEVLGLEDGEGLSHRLARDAHARGQAVLVETRAWRQPPVADGGEDGVVGLLDQRRARFQQIHSRIPHAK